MRVLNFFTFHLLLLLSCNTSYDPSNEISVALEINGEGNNGEVRLQKVNSDYSIELIQTSNFIDNNNLAQNESYAEGTYGKQKLVRKEPQPILSISRKALGKPPKFLRKDNSTK